MTNNKTIKILRLNLGKSYTEGMSFNDIYNAGKEAWKISKNIDRDIKLILFTYNKKIIGKCLVHKWIDNGERVSFDGIMIDLINDSDLSKLNGNPIKYEDFEIE